MSRVLITGISGFTGQYVSQHLIAKGYEVYGIVSSKGTAEKLRTGAEKGIYPCLLTDRATLGKVLLEVQPEYIIHLAAISFVGHSDRDAMYTTNVVGTENLLEAVEQNVKIIKRIIVASSANVYGNNEKNNLSETEVFSPMNHYAISKVAMEHMVTLYKHRLPVVVTRPFNYTGIGQSDKFLVPKIISHFKNKHSVIELGNLDVARDISDVRYVSEVYGELLVADSIDGSVFNVCSGNAVSLEEILDIAKLKTGHDIEIVVNPSFVRTNELKRLSGDNVKLTSMLKSVKQYDLDATLEWMLTG
jgi:nucleoside-diphosphate-sugar epimerase